MCEPPYCVKISPEHMNSCSGIYTDIGKNHKKINAGSESFLMRTDPWESSNLYENTIVYNVHFLN